MKNRFINISVSFIGLLVLFSSCKTEKKDLLCKKWKTVSIHNSKMDQELEFMKHYIDTIGTLDKEISEVVNLDSLKMNMRIELENSIKEQKLAIENTLMEFKSNGISYTTSIEGIDSAFFEMEGDEIKIDEAKLKGFGETMTFTILKLTPDTLKIRLIDYGDTSIAVMIPSK